MSKIVYKKTSDYENNLSTTSCDSSQINLDESIISVNNKTNNKNENWENNLGLINDINKEVLDNINKEVSNDINKEVSDDINENFNNNAQTDFNNISDTDLNFETSNNQKLENFFSDSDVERENNNLSFFDKLVNNDINAWLFIGMIVIGILIIMMILLTNNANDTNDTNDTNIITNSKL
jgi:hypothetical protein